MRPLRSPGLRPGSGASGFAEVFGVEMVVLLDAYRVQRRAGRQSGDDPLPDVHRKRFAGRQQPSLREFRHVPVDVPAVEPRHDLPLQQRIERLEADHPALGGPQRSLHGHPAPVPVAVVLSGLAEVRARQAVRRGELHHAGKIAGGHDQKTRTALALNANVTGLPGTRPSSRTASSVTTATSSTPTSAVTCTVPARAWASRVTLPENTLRAEEASGWRLTKISVGGTARIAGPARSVATVMAIAPTRACFAALALPVGNSTRNRFSGVTGDSLPSAI